MLLTTLIINGNIIARNATLKGGVIVINTAKLKGRIVEKNTTIGKLAEEIGLSAYSLGQKIGGRSIMTLGEAEQLQKLLDIPDSDFTVYFFADEVA